MGQYHTAQVCLEGHPVTDSIERSPELMQEHCSKCGNPTITQCPRCQAAIRGDYDVPGVCAIGFPYEPPSYCHACGAAFPWTEARIRAAIQMFVEFGEL